MASTALFCVFMLVVGTATAYPMRKEKFTSQERAQEDVVDQWNKEAEFENERQNDVYIASDGIFR